MKLNNTWMMAALVAGTVFAVDLTASAQDSTNTPAVRTPGAPGARGAGRFNFDTIATQLALTDDQKTKAKPIFEEMRTKMAEVRNDRALSPEDRPAKNKEIRDASNAKLKEIFTPEQYEKWQKMGQGGRRPGGAGAPPAGGDAKPPQ